VHFGEFLQNPCCNEQALFFFESAEKEFFHNSMPQYLSRDYFFRKIFCRCIRNTLPKKSALSYSSFGRKTPARENIFLNIFENVMGCSSFSVSYPRCV